MWASGTARDLHIELKRNWGKKVPTRLEGKLCEVSKEASQSIGGIFQGFLHRARAIPSMSYDVVLMFLRQSVE